MTRLAPRLAALAVTLTLCNQDSRAQWIRQDGGTEARLRGLSVVSSEVAWASGAEGTVIRTVDGGKTWRSTPVPGAKGLDFRDVEAFDASTAYLLSIGEGGKSRIYRTTDGGDAWSLQFRNDDPKGFLDALAFWDRDHGLALGDPVDGRYTILTTDDGGASWTKQGDDGMPPALANEGAFAASGACLVTHGERDAWFGTGGGGVARVFRSRDRGRTWTAYETPLRADSPTSGVFSLAFRDADHGVVVGGAYDQPDRKALVAATTDDGGKTWRPVLDRGPDGYRSAVAFMTQGGPHRLVAVGPTGADVSTDGGRTWTPLGTTGFHAVGFSSPGAGWAVGESGLVARFGGR